MRMRNQIGSSRTRKYSKIADRNSYKKQQKKQNGEVLHCVRMQINMGKGKWNKNFPSSSQKTELGAQKEVVDCARKKNKNPDAAAIAGSTAHAHRNIAEYRLRYERSEKR